MARPLHGGGKAEVEAADVTRAAAPERFSAAPLLAVLFIAFRREMSGDVGSAGWVRLVLESNWNTKHLRLKGRVLHGGAIRGRVNVMVATLGGADSGDI